MGKKKKNDTPGELLVCRNPKALQQYEIEERLEAGMVLMGSEVKSMRQRRADLDGAYGQVVNGEMILYKMHIAPYEQAGPFGHEPRRPRKLLMHRREIEKWEGRLTTQGYTCVPLAVYFKKGHAKVEIGLGRGRKRGDDRHELRKKAELKDARDAVHREKGRR